jgi:3-(3-hydroxy-phenyl)propionate hydroxylase
MREHAVLIAGGGPTGLMLAAELKIAGVDVAIVERRVNQELAGSRAGGLHARSLEILDQRGIVDRFLARGQKHPVLHFHLLPLDISDLPTPHNYVLGLFQNHIERLLAEWACELGVAIHHGREVVDFVQDENGVDVELSDCSAIRAQFLVGCDGGRSLVRKLAGIEFPGWDPTTSWMIAEVDFAQDPPWGMRRDAAGIHGIGKADSGQARVVLTERSVPANGEPTLDDLREALVGVYGSDFDVRNPTWISRFTDLTRQAAQYRKGRVLLAGDAAHVHPPVGGQGLNIGLQDAVNLGWKLAQVVKGISPDVLLDSYHAERHPVAARVLRNTMAQVALRRMDERTLALNEFVGELVNVGDARRKVATEMSGLGVHYPLGEGHALLGRRMPDLELETRDGKIRTWSLLHHGQAALIRFGQSDGIDITGWSDRVRLVDARYTGSWELPALGDVPAPDAVLVRPDGHVAWIGDRSRSGLADALTNWFGAAR